MSDPDLVVAYNFAPYADASAITTLKRIVARGLPVDVVSNRLDGIREIDSSLSQLASPFLRSHALLAEPVSFSQWTSVRDFTQAGLDAVREMGRSHRCVYSRSMWAHSHFLAAALKILGVVPEWTAEFSDPLRRTVDGSRRPSGHVPQDPLAGLLLAGVPSAARHVMSAEREVFDWAEILPLALADRVVFTNDNQREVVVDGIRSPWLRQRLGERAEVSPHPSIRWDARYEDPAAHLERIDGALHMAYFGTFYANRGLGSLLEVMAHFRNRGTCVMLDVYSEASQELQAASCAAGVRDLLRFRDRVPYATACTLQSQYDVLVTNDVIAPDFGGRQPFLPSKLSDYSAAGVPVLALVEPGSPTSQLGLEHAAPLGDMASLVDVVERLVSETRRAPRGLPVERAQDRR